jgi:hypothetical protein
MNFSQGMEIIFLQAEGLKILEFQMSWFQNQYFGTYMEII